MESDAMSELSEISTATSTRSKKLRFRPAKKQKQEKDSRQTKTLSSASSSKSSSILSLSRKSGKSHGMDSQVKSPDGLSPAAVASDDIAIRFSGEGVTFKAKLIGVDPVSAPRGDQMCRAAMTRLKAIVKGTGSHKKKIILSISLDGIKITDEKSREVISQHPIPLISYISRDTSDNRAFGFVFGSPSDGHQFIGIKTDGPALPVMQTIADLFTFVYEQRKREKSLPKDHNHSSPSRSTVLSFSSKEEFSTEKVNAAWTRSEPPVSRTHMLSTSDLSTGASTSRNLSTVTSSSSSILPLPLLPPPKLGESISSRTSTMNSGQRSDVLNELRSMRHVMNSAREAAASSADTNNRYATWESFDEESTSDTVSHVNSQVSSGLSASLCNQTQDQNQPTAALQTSHRTNSMRSIGSDTLSEFSTLSHKSFSSSGRPQHPALSGSVHVPSPPSSPRSGSRSNRLRRGVTIDQPKTVALPPVIGSSFTSSMPHPVASNFPNRQVPASHVSFSSFPNRCEPHVNESKDKFEVNFDAVFTSFEASHALHPPVNPVPIHQSTQPTSEKTADPNDRYAVFQEIQNLDSFPSIFDTNPSSSSDSDTLTPTKSSAVSTTPGNKSSNQETDLFGSSSWVRPPQASDLPVPPPLVPVPVNPDLVTGRPDIPSSRQTPDQVSASARARGNSEASSKSLKDVATSPGTPPSPVHSVSSQIIQSESREKSSAPDPFSDLSLKEFQPANGSRHADKNTFFQVCNPNVQHQR